MDKEEERPPFNCPHCGAGPFDTRDGKRKHIFDKHIEKPTDPVTPTRPTPEPSPKKPSPEPSPKP